MIFPTSNKGLANRKQPAKERQTENERAQIKEWCDLARGVKAKRRKKGA